mgnify:CR=1 FL=1
MTGPRRRDWTRRQTGALRKMLLAVASDPRLVLTRASPKLVALRHAAR